LDVGVWDAAHGLIVYDDLFPHFTGGLRQRVINVTTMEVFNFFLFIHPVRKIFLLFISFLRGKSLNETATEK